MASSFSSPWPDPNSPLLSKNDFGVPLVELFKWLDVRDTLLGANFKEQDITAASALACECKHPDAMWLASIFEGKDVSTKEDAREVFLQCENDPRALCFAWWMTDGDDSSLIRRAAEMGYAFACAALCQELWFQSKEEVLLLAKVATSKGEREGFYWLGRCYHLGVGEVRNLILAKQNFFVSAELGDVSAALQFALLLDQSDPACWIWFARVALHGSPLHLFHRSFAKQVLRFFSGSGNATVVFLIGLALKGNIDVKKKMIFGDDYNFDSLIGPANQAVSFYDSQIRSARVAVDTWTLVATRLNLIKDMKIVIGKIIWEGRFEANYKIEK